MPETQVIPCLSCWAGNHHWCERPDDIDNDAEDPNGNRYTLIACCCGGTAEVDEP